MLPGVFVGTMFLSSSASTTAAWPSRSYLQRAGLYERLGDGHCLLEKCRDGSSTLSLARGAARAAARSLLPVNRTLQRFPDLSMSMRAWDQAKGGMEVWQVL